MRPLAAPIPHRLLRLEGCLRAPVRHTDPLSRTRRWYRPHPPTGPRPYFNTLVLMRSRDSDEPPGSLGHLAAMSSQLLSRFRLWRPGSVPSRRGPGTGSPKAGVRPSEGSACLLTARRVASSFHATPSGMSFTSAEFWMAHRRGTASGHVSPAPRAESQGPSRPVPVRSSSSSIPTT